MPQPQVRWRSIGLSSSDDDSSLTSRDAPTPRTSRKYGMFSRAVLPSFSNSQSSPAKRRRLQTGCRIQHGQNLQNKVASRKEKPLLELDRLAMSRDESPLFEPDQGPQEDGGASEDSAAPIEISPPVNSNETAGHSTVSQIRTHKQSSVETSDQDLSLASNIASTSDKDTQTECKNTALEKLSRIYADTPLPGSSDVLPEYRKALALIEQYHNIRNDYEIKLHEYNDEDRVLVKEISDLPNQEAARKTAITQSLAAAIQRDMSKSFANDEDLLFVVSLRRDEAQKAHEELAQQLSKQRAARETRRQAISEMKSTIRVQMCDLEKGFAPLKDQKAELERQGGMAMMFTLCQQLLKEDT